MSSNKSNKQYQNQVALVTGSAKNLGRATAVAFAQAGATVVVNYRQSQREAEATFGKIKKLSPDSLLVKVDVTREEEVKKLFAQIKKKYGCIDIIINNVGDFLYKPLAKTSGEEFFEVINNNLVSAHLVSQAAIKLMMHNKLVMRGRDDKGVIINIAAVGAEQMITPENTTPYYIAKTGVIMLTRALARQYASVGIRVNAISPGILESSLVKGRQTPLGRYTRFDDIIRAIMWLSDPASEYVTGANIEVSGGWSPI